MKRVTRYLGPLVMAVLFMAVSGLSTWAAWEAGSSGGVLSGKIASIDIQQNLLKVKTGLFTQKDFVIESSTKISDGIKEMKLEELKPGDKVTLSFDEADGKRVVSSLMVNKPAAASKAEPEAAQPQTASSGAATPEASPYQAAQPEPAQPQSAQPQSAQPQPAEPMQPSGSALPEEQQQP